MGHHWLKPNWDPGLSISELPINHFLDIGIQGLVLDVDRTLLPGKELLLPNSVKSWAINAQRHLQLHLLSNNPSRKRIAAVADQLNVGFTCKAGKPRKGALLKALEDLQIKPTNIAIVGDRLFTDVLAGNRLGLYTVLVRPIGVDGYSCSKNTIQRFEQKLAGFLGANQT